MAQTAVQEPKKARGPLNGVDTPSLFATINAVAANPPLARFQFRAKNRWVSGTHSRGTVETFFGAGTEQAHQRTFTLEADHPAVLVGGDNAPLPVEIVLYGLAACITSGIANIAAARGVKLTEVESVVEGDMDLRGILGLSGEVRNGYEKYPRQLHHQGRCAGRQAPAARRAVEGPLGGVRHHHQRRAR